MWSRVSISWLSEEIKIRRRSRSLRHNANSPRQCDILVFVYFPYWNVNQKNKTDIDTYNIVCILWIICPFTPFPHFLLPVYLSYTLTHAFPHPLFVRLSFAQLTHTHTHTHMCAYTHTRTIFTSLSWHTQSSKPFLQVLMLTVIYICKGRVNK